MNIGIIGGADGPTSIYVASAGSPYTIVAVIAACIAAAVIIRRIKKRKM